MRTNTDFALHFLPLEFSLFLYYLVFCPFFFAKLDINSKYNEGINIVVFVFLLRHYEVTVITSGSRHQLPAV